GRPIFALDRERVLVGFSVYNLTNRLPSEAYPLPPSAPDTPGGVLGVGPDGRAWISSPDLARIAAATERPRNPQAARAAALARIAAAKLPGAAALAENALSPRTLRALTLGPVPGQKPVDGSWFLGPHNPIAVEVDLGDVSRSRDLARNQARALTVAGLKLGPGGWRLKADSRVVLTEFDATYSKYFHNHPVPPFHP